MASPVVTVLTPVYNGERYLAACIESVLRQTYPHWDYVIVDNASTDGTAEIARAYAARDRRIRVHTNERLITVIENHNVAVRQLSPTSTWCKFVSADDILLPECLERMVELGAQQPSVGLVGAYQLQGSRVGLGGLPYPSPITPGRTIARACLLGALAVFGNPSAHMFRADIVRRRSAFYDESMLHADEAACYDVLKTEDFGFVHQVLTCARLHRGSITFSRARRLNTYLLDHMRMLKEYGPFYLTSEEYALVVQERLSAYYTFMVRVLLSPARREIWRYHAQGLRELGFPLQRRRLLGAVVRELRDAVLPRGAQFFEVVRQMRSPADDDESHWREWWAPTGFERIRSVGRARNTTD
jgi:glycosyltransferase involved in cell wall biosynthesis